MKIELLNIILAMGILGAIVLGANVYTNQIFYNEAQAQIYSGITNQTTNAETVNCIKEICNNTPWYILKTDCEATLYKKFIIPTSP